MDHTTIRSRPAIGIGLLCAVGSAAVMVADIRHSGPSVDHLLSVLVLIGTIAAGHMCWPSLREWRVFSGLGFALLFVVGTIYCAASTAGRTAEESAIKANAARASNKGRELIETELTQARVQLGLASAEVLRECRDGVGPKCKNFQGRERAYQALVDSHTLALANAAPDKPENVKVKNLASMWAVVKGDDAKRIEALLAIFDPFVPALFLELGAITFLSRGFGRREAVMEILPPARAVQIDPVFEALKDGPLTNDELAERLGIRKGTASKLVSARLGQIKRERVGREVRISLAAPTMH